MRPLTFWERLRRRIVWGQWSIWHRPMIVRDGGKVYAIVISKLKIITRKVY